MPSIRQLRRLKSVARVKDGRNSKDYELRSAYKNDNGDEEEWGILMCDEIKLKEGMIFSAITGEVIGIADEIVDQKSVFCRLFSVKGDTIELAIYAKQWRFKRLDKK